MKTSEDEIVFHITNALHELPNLRSTFFGHDRDRALLRVTEELQSALRVARIRAEKNDDETSR